MSYGYRLLRQSDSFAGYRNVGAVAWNATQGLWQITLTANEGHVALGSLFEIRQSGTAANNDCWTIVWLNATAPQRIFCVAETMTAQGASGNGVSQFQGTLKVSGTTVTSFVDTQTIQATGANFVTNNVVRGDRLAIYSGAYLNAGSYFVLDVIDENNVTVVSRTMTYNPLTVAGVTGETLLVYDGYAGVYLVDEASPTWATIESNYPFFVDSETVPTPSGDFTEYAINSLREIEFWHTTAASTEFVSEKEIVRHRSTDTTTRRLFADWDIGGYSTGTIIRLGQEGSDAQGFSLGSHWFGNWGASTTNPEIHWEIFGSSICGPCGTGDGGKLIGSLVSEGSLSESDVTNEITWYQVLNATSSGAPPNILTGNINITDLFLGDTNDFSFIVFETTYIASFRISDDLYLPPWQLFSSTAVFRDPKEDYALSDLRSFWTGDSGSTARIEYAWRPRFVYVDSTGSVTSAVSGLTVDVYEIIEAIPTESSFGSYTTNSNGFINSGDPLYLKARADLIIGSRVTYEFSARMIVQGSGYQFINKVFKMRAPFDGDIPVEILGTDFEGETHV